MSRPERSIFALVGFICCLAFVSSSLAQHTQQLPKTEGESLAGHKVVLPDAAAGNIAVLIFGFSKASKVPTSAWARKLQVDFGTRTGFALYQLPVLEDVPKLIRGMVISGIKKGVPENARDRFVPILQGEADLKSLVHYKEQNDAYLVILDRAGHIVQQSHGAPNETNYPELQGQIESLLSEK
jgi:hypothetical protein